jgi:predicted MFS family arabinose efflux permease
VIGGLMIARLVSPDRRPRWIAPLAICAGLPLLVSVTQPGLVVTALSWMLCGLLTAYQLPANTAFAVTVPDRHRGQAMGVVQTGLAVGQGLGMLGAGILADRFDPMTVIAGSGLVACVLAVLIVATGPRLGDPEGPDQQRARAAELAPRSEGT